MNWFARNVLGPLGLVFALVAAGLSVAAYHYAAKRDEQARAIPNRQKRGETELAEQHREGAKLLAEYSAVLVDLGYLAAAVALYAAAAAAWTGPRRNRWMAVVTVVLLLVCVALGIASRPDPALIPNAE